jgi:hypothetical protein
MDIAGAKALKKRLGENGASDIPPASVDVPEDAPPVYHYLGVSDTPPESPTAVIAEAPPKRHRFWLRRRRHH